MQTENLKDKKWQKKVQARKKMANATRVFFK